MSTKIKTIVLKVGFAMRDDIKVTTGYRVMQITDSVEYEPGTVIGKSEVEQLCSAKDWKVTIKPYND